MEAFALQPDDDDVPAWVTEPSRVELVEGGWEPGELLPQTARTRWTRQQRRVYRGAQWCIQRHESAGRQGLWIMLSSSNKSDPAKIAAHHAQLRRLVEARYGGRIHHFTVRTAEARGVDPERRGVLHVLWFWEPPVGAPHRYFQVPQRWLSQTWERLHGASYVWIVRYRPGGASRKRVSRYVVTQYVTGQPALVRYSWSWRITFAVGIVALWKSFRCAHGGTLGEMIATWSRVLAGELVEVGGHAFVLTAT